MELFLTGWSRFFFGFLVLVVLLCNQRGKQECGGEKELEKKSSFPMIEKRTIIKLMTRSTTYVPAMRSGGVSILLQKNVVSSDGYVLPFFPFSSF